jgi:acyl transferase domain-containing protein
MLATVVLSDGPSASLSAPNGSTQRYLIALVQQKSETNRLPASIEAHGTGTALGDPVEVGAIVAALSGSEVITSSIKANIGHLESSAAGGGALSLISSSLTISCKSTNCQLYRINPHLVTQVKFSTFLMPVETLILR